MHTGKKTIAFCETLRALSGQWRGRLPAAAPVAAELLAIVLWALIVTKPYLNMDPHIIPSSFQPANEYLGAIQSHHIWNHLTQCGWCFLWHGNLRGGAPAFIDTYGSMLHPLVILTNLAWGVQNGTKLALVGAFIMAGFAQWWLGRVLGLGRVARTWSGCMAVVAGHLSRIELGTFGLTLSTAACALVLPMLIGLSQRGTRRQAVLLGITLALALLSGQGYMQIGLLLIMPTLALLLFWQRQQAGLLMRRYALAGVLALLLAAPFLVPFLHFQSQFIKPTFPDLKIGQPLSYTLFNLVISDYEFYLTPELDKFQHPWLYMNYVGWIPLLLALWGLRGVRSPQEGRMLIYLVLIAFLPLWIGSDGPLQLVVETAPTWIAERLLSVRYYPMIAGLAVPPILALSAIGLDKLITAAPWHLKLVPGAPARPPIVSFDMRWLLVVPLALALHSGLKFTSQWIETRPVPAEVNRVLLHLRTPDLQWVSAPGYDFTEPAVRMGLKLSHGMRPWGWKNRPEPQPARWAVRRDAEQPQPADATLVTSLENWNIYTITGREYAAIEHPDGTRTVCAGYGTGGNIDIYCDDAPAGTLTVKEHTWPGWLLRIDGKPAKPMPATPENHWLRTEVPAGSRLIQFRYRPWDVTAGLLLCVVGMAIAAFQWWRGRGE